MHEKTKIVLVAVSVAFVLSISPLAAGASVNLGWGGYSNLPTVQENFDFIVTASSENVPLAENSAITTITVTHVAGVSENVTLSGNWVENTPAGVNADFSTTFATPNFTSTLTFTKDQTTVSGAYTFRVTATGEVQSRTQDVNVTVAPPVGVPTLISPGNGVATDSLTPTFDWSDDAGAENYRLQVATDNNFDNVFFAKLSFESTAVSLQLSYGNVYYWRVRGENPAVEGEWSENRVLTIKLSPPKVAALLLAGGATYTNSDNVQLTISSQNAADMSFSSDGTTWDDWETYSPTKSYSLSSGDGAKNLYIRVRDNVGDISQSLKSSITLDETSPTTSHIPRGTEEDSKYRGSVIVDFSSQDATSGVGSTMYRVDNGEWKTGTNLVITEEGTHIVEYYSIDLAGNMEETNTFEVTVFVPSAIPEGLWILLGALGAAVVGVAVAYPSRKHKGKLKSIYKERGELVRLMKKTETKFYKKATISRDNFDTVMNEYRRRMAELEKEERLLTKNGKKKI